MENNCNSFYAKEEPVITATPVVEIPEITEDQTTPKAKKKSILWYWAASAFVAVLLSPDENINSIDTPPTP